MITNKGDSKIIEMLSLTEEINRINQKVNQLVQDLHGIPQALGAIQELTEDLNTKVGHFSNIVGEYEPVDVGETIREVPSSYESEVAGTENSEPQDTIVVTPENVHLYQEPQKFRDVKPVPKGGNTTTTTKTKKVVKPEPTNTNKSVPKRRIKRTDNRVQAPKGKANPFNKFNSSKVKK